MQLTDKPTKIRPGQEINPKRLEGYLRSQLTDLPGESLQIQQFPSGYSNLTYLIRCGSREFILRKPPSGKKAKTAHDMQREFKILKALEGEFPYSPKPVLYCQDQEIIGDQFYLMQRLTGIIPRKDLPEGLSLSPEQAKLLCQKKAQVLNKLHSLDHQRLGLTDLGKPEGYVERQVQGWSRRYQEARTPDVPDFEEVMDWLKKNHPKEVNPPCLIHNDFKFDNLVLDPKDPLRIVGVLDWEMATIGEPLMDLGSTLGYWVQADDPEEMQIIRTLPTTLPGIMSRREFFDYYCQISKIRPLNFEFFLCFGFFRLAVIAQQIYYRYYHGQTQDQRFAQLAFAVAILEKAAKRVLD